MSNQLCLSKILIFMYCISFLKIVSIHLIVFDWPLGLGFDYLFAAAAKLLQSCSTLCIPIDGSPPGSPIHGILQARILEWIAISFSNAWKWKVTVKSLSRVWLLVTPWTAAYQSAPSMEFSRQEYWSGLPLPSLDYLFSVLIFCFVSNNSNNCNFLSFLIIFKLLLLVSYFLMGFMFDWELFLQDCSIREKSGFCGTWKHCQHRDNYLVWCFPWSDNVNSRTQSRSVLTC